MSIESLDDAVAGFLSVLERKETSLLSWGAVNGYFALEEVEDLAAEFVARHSLWNIVPDPVELVDELIERSLLFEFSDNGQYRCRTRMAEAVRLFSRLRQLFPKHLSNKTWRNASSLVADYRLITRPRSYPKRELPPAEVMGRLEELSELDALGLDAIRKMLGEKIELAKFQYRATERIVEQSDAARSSGTVICAGTGSGKTLAFYLPALAHMVPLIDENAWTRCLAIYPRNELLKDQFSGTYEQARKLDPIMKKAGTRKLRIGALFGSIPNKYREDLRKKGWQRKGDGYVCPFLQCSSCSGELIWRDEIRQNKRERLECRTCSHVVTGDEVMLTRKRMKESPPDILFTTTEMLNQRITDSRMAHLFGVGVSPNRKPRFVLLDEVHTYGGIHGAQVAYLLRRWRRASGSRPHFVGLSATLRDARNFFARLAGLDEYRVTEISPGQDEIIQEGMEYNLALRGDPVSKASLLSTTIQAAMLMGRVLDPRDANPSEGLFGSRSFLFTDDLDVTNRLFFNLLDAEGRDSWGKPNQERPSGSLANLRADKFPEGSDRFAEGQAWDLVCEIGHPLGGGAGLEVSRTSSQDSGVTSDSELVVATASLEVGYNDPTVGSVIQHKAPRDEAQFLQRKGRAGRPRGMRPWTVVVLSDYGRDRMAYQAYEQLFDPELRPRSLPVSNIYVTRMQATYAFMDWVASKMCGQSVHVWRVFSGPADKTSSWFTKNRERQKEAAQIVERLLVDDEVREDFSQYLETALKIDDDQVHTVLWEPPRALMSSVVPTILRRLKTNWKRAQAVGDEEHDYHVGYSPLPEFVPSSLFSDLNLPEVTVVTPPQTKYDDARKDPMPILQAMREYSPGRISRRFGVGHEYVRHWIGPANLAETQQQELQLENYCPVHEELGHFQMHQGEDAQDVRVVRPWQFEPVQPKGHIADSSNSSLDWRTQIIPPDEGWAVEVPDSYRLSGWVESMEFFTHNHFSPVEVRRFAIGSDARITFRNGNALDTYFEFTDGEEPVGVGFVLDVDGFVVRVKIPEKLALVGQRGNTETIRALRTQYFRFLVENAQNLEGSANYFQRGWLSEVYLSALSRLALEREESVQQAWNHLKSEGGDTFFEDVLRVIFESTGQKGDDNGQNSRRIYDELLALLNEPGVRKVLHSNAKVLWEDPDESWNAWLSEKLLSTYGAALLEACHQLCPNIESGDLILDISSGPRPPEKTELPSDVVEVWLTETTVGGGGAIEQVLERYGEDPHRFFQLVEGALEPTELEQMDVELQRLLDWAVTEEDAEVQDALRKVRNFETHQELRGAFNELTELLAAQGLFVSHSVVTALNARILRPGSSHSTDALLKQLLDQWQAEEERLGIEIDARVFSYVASESDDIEGALAHIEEGNQSSRQWRFNTLYSLLWPRGGDVRARSLGSYNPYASLPDTERLLLADSVDGGPAIVELEDDDWHAALVQELRENGRAALRSRRADLQEMKTAISTVVARAIDVGFMLIYPRIRGVEKRRRHVEVIFELTEIV